MEIDGMTQLLAQLGIAGVLAWYLYYTTTVSFPRMNETTLDRMDAMAHEQSHRMDAMAHEQSETIKSVCGDFTATIREERVARREELKMLRDDLQRRDA